ncbi:MAG: tripartite tricarboxylate transporter substrate binding protein [Comamonadaceae bacterium]|nr:MAG: tripartite tricarboxylate transporter substrate binding protein [Comamonadaceae bacterium]
MSTHHHTPARPWRLAAVAAALLSLGSMTSALAQAWPDKPLKVIVGFPPGGAADQIARLVSTPLATALGQPVVVENRPGANGNIAGEAVVKSPADGYTLLMGSGGMVSVNPHISRMSFDPVKDLVPVASAARVLVYLMARPTIEAKNVQELIAYAKANPGRLTYGSAGSGSSPHLAGEMLKSQAGMFAVHVPYRGAAPALTDLMGGQIDYYFDPGIGLSHARAGRTKLLAVGSLKRSPLFPDVPTLDEVGLKGFDADTVFGFYAPAATPPAVITRLNTEINKILATAAVKDRITALGGEALPLSPAEFGKRGLDDSQRFGAIIRERKITAD